jgi:uncharacterized protein (TIGR02001 family)
MKGTTMKNLKGLVLGIGAAALLSGTALAADALVRKAPPPAPAAATPLWDLAFGTALMSDYNFRGVSQSNREISFGAYAELQFNSSIGTFYTGLAAWRVNWPSTPAFGFTNPAAEVDFTGGWRNKWGAFALDLGFIYYYYPNEVFNGFTNNSDFWEFAVKAAYDITPDLTVGVNVFYSPDVLNYSQTFAFLGINAKAQGTYVSVTGKWVTPWKSGDLGAYFSGELGHWWLSTTGFLAAGYVDPSYNYGNIGLAFTWKTLTLDFRYHANDLSVLKCTSFLLSAVGNPSNAWCGNTFIVALKFDTSLSGLGIIK